MMEYLVASSLWRIKTKALGSKLLKNEATLKGARFFSIFKIVSYTDLPVEPSAVDIDPLQKA